MKTNQIFFQIKGEPSSSSNHIVLQRLKRAGEEEGGLQRLKRVGEEEGELPSIGEEDIDNVIGSCKWIIRFFKLNSWLGISWVRNSWKKFEMAISTSVIISLYSSNIFSDSIDNKIMIIIRKKLNIKKMFNPNQHYFSSGVYWKSDD